MDILQARATATGGQAVAATDPADRATAMQRCVPFRTRARLSSTSDLAFVAARLKGVNRPLARLAEASNVSSATRMLPPSNFGVRAATGGSKGAPRSLTNERGRTVGVGFQPGDLSEAAALWVADCRHAAARQYPYGEGSTRDLISPWVTNRRTFLVYGPPPSLTDEELAERVISHGFAVEHADKHFPAKTITVIGRDVGPRFTAYLQDRYPDVTVYASAGSGAVLAGTEAGYERGGFVVRDGQHFKIYGELTPLLRKLIVDELVHAQLNGWTYTPENASTPGLDDRAGTHRLVGRAVAEMSEQLRQNPTRLDLARLTAIAEGHAQPGIVVWAVVEVLHATSLLDAVDLVNDLHRDEREEWHAAPVPVEVRRRYTATGPHAGAERTVRFAGGEPLLSGDATRLPVAPATSMDRAAVALWLAEIAFDRVRSGDPLPVVRTGGADRRETEAARLALRKEVAARLLRFGVTTEEIERSVSAMLPAPTADESPGVAEVTPERVTGYGHTGTRTELPPTAEPRQVALALYRAAVRRELASRGNIKRKTRDRELNEVDHSLLTEVVVNSGVHAAIPYAELLAVQSVEPGMPPAELPPLETTTPREQWPEAASVADVAREVVRLGRPARLATDSHEFALIPAGGGVRFADPGSGRVYQNLDVPQEVREAGRITATPIGAGGEPAWTPVEPSMPPVRETLHVDLGADAVRALDAITASLDGADRDRLDAARRFASEVVEHFRTERPHANEQLADTLDVLARLLHIQLTRALVAAANPGDTAAAAVLARAPIATLTGVAEPELRTFLLHHEQVLRDLFEASFRQLEPGFLTDLRIERNLGSVPEDLWSVPLLDERTGVPVAVADDYITEFVYPRPSAARLRPPTDVVDSAWPGYLTLKVRGTPPPEPPGDGGGSTSEPAGSSEVDVGRPPAPWFTREEGLLGDGYVRDVPTLPDELLRDLRGQASRRVPADAVDWVSGLAESTDSEAWQRLLTAGEGRSFGTSFVRVHATVGKLVWREPVPADDPAVSRYKSKYGDTTYIKERSRIARSGFALPGTFLLRLAGETLAYVAAPIVRLQAGGSRTVSDRIALEVQSGNRPLVNDVHDYTTTVVLRVEVDGEPAIELPLPNRLTLGLPAAFATSDPSPTTSLDVRNAEALHDEDYGVHAVGFEPLLAEIETRLREEYGLTRGESARVLQELRGEMLNEKTGKDRNQWWTANAWVSPFIDVALGGRRRFQGSLTVSGTLTAVSRAGSTPPVPIRNDIAGTQTRHRGRSQGTSFGAQLGVDLTVLLNLGRFVLTPRFNVLNVGTSHDIRQGHSAMAQSKVALMHKDRLRRYRAELRMTAEFTSNLGTVTVTGPAVAELAVPAQRATHFEWLIKREVQAAASQPPLPAGPPRRKWWHLNGWAVTANARALLEAGPAKPFGKAGVRGPGDLKALARQRVIEVVVPAGGLLPDWEWLPSHPNVTVVAETEPRRGVARFRYLLEPDGRVRGAWSLLEHGPVGYTANPAARRATPVSPDRPMAVVPAPASAPAEVRDPREPWVLASRAGLGPGVVKEMPGAQRFFPLVYSMALHQIGAAGTTLNAEQQFERARALAQKFGVPGLRGHARTLFDGGVTDEFTVGGHTFRVELIAHLTGLRVARSESDTAVDVQGRAMAAHSIHESNGSKLGVSVDIAFRTELGHGLSGRVRALEVAGGVATGNGRTGDDAAKSYRRRAAGGEAVIFDYNVTYRLMMSATHNGSGRIVSALGWMMSGQDYHVPVRVSAADILPGPPRLLTPADAVRVALRGHRDRNASRRVLGRPGQPLRVAQPRRRGASCRRPAHAARPERADHLRLPRTPRHRGARPRRVPHAAAGRPGRRPRVAADTAAGVQPRIRGPLRQTAARALPRGRRPVHRGRPPPLRRERVLRAGWPGPRRYRRARLEPGGQHRQPVRREPRLAQWRLLRRPPVGLRPWADGRRRRDQSRDSFRAQLQAHDGRLLRAGTHPPAGQGAAGTSHAHRGGAARHADIHAAGTRPRPRSAGTPSGSHPASRGDPACADPPGTRPGRLSCAGARRLVGAAHGPSTPLPDRCRRRRPGHRTLRRGGFPQRDAALALPDPAPRRRPPAARIPRDRGHDVARRGAGQRSRGRAAASSAASGGKGHDRRAGLRPDA